jgi:hypothetical protein
MLIIDNVKGAVRKMQTSLSNIVCQVAKCNLRAKRY